MSCAAAMTRALSLQLGATLDGYGVVPGVTLEGLKKVRERNSNLFG